MTQAGEVTCDAFLEGRVHVFQPVSGYRAGLDAVLLAAALEGSSEQRLAEAGCGAGAAILCAARRLEGAVFAGFERDATMAGLAQKGVLANGFSGRVEITLADIAHRPPDLENAFDQAFANPPFFDPSAVRRPSPERAAAYLAKTPLKAWLLYLMHLVRPGGRITLIHRAAALGELMEILAGRCGEIELLPVRPAPGAQAHRLLVRARKGLRRGPVKLYEGLTLHVAAGGALTERAAAALRGDALEWR